MIKGTYDDLRYTLPRRKRRAKKVKSVVYTIVGILLFAFAGYWVGRLVELLINL